GRWVPQAERRQALRRRRDLLAARRLEEARAGPLGAVATDLSIEGGLLSLTLTAQRLAEAGPGFVALARSWWARGVRLTLADAAVAPVARPRGRAAVSALSLSGQGVGDDGLAALLASPHLGALRELDLSHNALTDRAVRALAASPLAARLTRLDLRSNAVRG